MCVKVPIEELIVDRPNHSEVVNLLYHYNHRKKEGEKEEKGEYPCSNLLTLLPLLL